jgi:hypothetical protein
MRTTRVFPKAVVTSILLVTIFGINSGCPSGDVGSDTVDKETTLGTADVIETADMGEVETKQEVQGIVPECQPATASTDCDDGVACTADECYSGTCVNSPRAFMCDDGDECTIDTCNREQVTNGGCSNKARVCIDNDICTLDGVCNADIGCDFSKSNPAGCAGLGNECTDAICVPGSGCQLTPVVCEDGNISTVDACVLGKGCVHQLVECGGPSFGDCVPSTSCMIAQCVAGLCQEMPKFCDDDIPCTQDFCDTNGMCQNMPNATACPDDGKFCTFTVCDVTFGCVQQPVGCDDGNPCTFDKCEEGVGCTHVLDLGCCLDEGDCNDGNPCTTDVCNPLNTCVNMPLDPDDGISCTLDTCVPNGSTSFFDHKTDDSLCSGDLKCSASLGCVECTSYDDCQDNSACTIDSCDWKTGSCIVEVRDCKDFEECTEPYGICEPKAGACNSDYECEDVPHDEHCQDVQCVDNWCTAVSNTDGNWCPGSNQCSQGVCQGGACVQQEQTCTTSSPCDIGVCNPATGGCSYEWKCDDGDDCTNDTCDSVTGKCKNVPDPLCIACDPEAEVSGCPTDLVCEGLKKQVQYSGNCWQHGRCEFSSYICQDNPCSTSWCGEGIGCYSQPKCDDGNPCTTDYCTWDTGACSNEPVFCKDDEDPCTIPRCFELLEGDPPELNGEFVCGFESPTGCTSDQ